MHESVTRLPDLEWTAGCDRAGGARLGGGEPAGAGAAAAAGHGPPAQRGHPGPPAAAERAEAAEAGRERGHGRAAALRGLPRRVPVRGTSVVGKWGAANSAVKVASRTEVSCRTRRVPVRGTSVEDRRGQRPELHVGVRHVGVRHGSANGMGLSESFL